MSEGINVPLNTPGVVIFRTNDNGIPKLNGCCAILILILNIILPGWGTIILGLMSGSNCCSFFCEGVLQFLTAICIVGWIWSIMTGCKVLDKSRSPEITFK